MDRFIDENSSLEDWLEMADYIAKTHFSGHFTLLSFTYSYKFTFGTVLDRDDINDLECYKDLKDAIINAYQEFLQYENNVIKFSKFKKPEPKQL